MPQLVSFSPLWTFRASSLARLFRVDTWFLQWRLLYDKNGNLIGNTINNKRQFEYVYDAQNRLIQVNRYNDVTGKEVLISFSYDALGRRTSKRVVNVVYEYIYSGNDIIEETQSNINPTSGVKVKKETREYTYGSRGTDDIVSVRFNTYTRQNKQDVLTTTGDYYYEKNHLGSIVRITSSTGWIVDEYSYTVFGKAYRKNLNWLYKPVAWANDSAIWNTRLFTGREYDTETWLYYQRARHYDPASGRFLQKDPIGTKDDVNLYRYVKNSPLNFVDRMGLNSRPIITTSMAVGEIFWWHIRWRNAIKRNLEYINSFSGNAEYIKAIIYEEQAHLTPDEVLFDSVHYDFSSYWKSRGLWQINYNPTQSDIDFFWYSAVSLSDVIDERININLMNDRIDIIKRKLEENGKEVSMENVWSAWNGGQSCVVWECQNLNATSYGKRVEWYNVLMWQIEQEKSIKEKITRFINSIVSHF